MTDRRMPVAVSGLPDAVQVSAGGDFSCAVRGDGSVVCWGGNVNGQLGRGSTMAGAGNITIRNVQLGGQMTYGATDLTSYGTRVAEFRGEFLSGVKSLVVADCALDFSVGNGIKTTAASVPVVALLPFMPSSSP